MKRRAKNTLAQRGMNHGQPSTGQSTDVTKMMSKEFDKLSKGELEEVTSWDIQVNSNKYYFLGNEKAINYFELYLKQNHCNLV